jgi:hypothetical protein
MFKRNLLIFVSPVRSVRQEDYAPDKNVQPVCRSIRMEPVRQTSLCAGKLRAPLFDRPYDFFEG